MKDKLPECQRNTALNLIFLCLPLIPDIKFEGPPGQFFFVVVVLKNKESRVILQEKKQEKKRKRKRKSCCFGGVIVWKQKIYLQFLTAGISFYCTWVSPDSFY